MFLKTKQLEKFFCIIVFIISSTITNAQTFIIDSTWDYNYLVKKHFLNGENEGLKVDHITFKGQKGSIGIFNYESTFRNLPNSGIILSTGMVEDAYGKNTITASSQNNFPGDSELDKIVENKTFDAAVLEFDFFSMSDSIAFVFQFASEEYPEYVNEGVSDVFAFLVKDKKSGEERNLAVLPGSNIPITIDNVNSHTNKEYYISNSYIDFENNKRDSNYENYLENSYIFKFDGFTQPIKSGLKVKPYHTYHFKIAIADVGDQKFDSWVFLKANSFASVGKSVNPKVDDLKKLFKFQNLNEIETTSLDSGIKIIEPIYFEFNSSVINIESFSILNQISEILKFSNYNMVIKGYADEKGSEDYNLKLSKERADKVSEYLIKKGIDPHRIQAVGMGEIALNDDQKSRKVEFILK